MFASPQTFNNWSESGLATFPLLPEDCSATDPEASVPFEGPSAVEIAAVGSLFLGGAGLLPPVEDDPLVGARKNPFLHEGVHGKLFQHFFAD